jgi:uncharacterized membrane protein
LLTVLTLFTLVFSLIGCRAMPEPVPEPALTPQSVQGRYHGRLPCADCPGIEYDLELRADGTYRESSVYADRSDQPFLESGTYTIDGDRVVLGKSDAGMQFFAVHPQGLQVLDIHGAPITGALSGHYLLTRQPNPDQAMPREGTMTLMQEKRARGIGFYAVGNEPSWSLEIDFDKGMRFTSLTDLPEMNTPPGRESRAQDADVTRYLAQTEAGTLIATALRGQCLDNMSGEDFPFRVRVEIKRSTDADYTLFEGCGNYVEDYRLNDIWVLTRLGDRPLAAQDFTRGLPTIEFHMADNRVVGHGGCNRFSGSFQVRGNQITFRQIAATRMACPDMDVEKAFLSGIANQTLRYRLDDGRLVLKDGEDIALVFSKIG